MLIPAKFIQGLYAIAPLLVHNSGAHNALYRGKNLGTALTEVQSVAIRAGTFEDIYPGDYWTITVPAYTWIDSNDTEQHESPVTVTFRVADLDYYLRTGITELTTHHVVVVPDNNLYNARMSSTGDTRDGYAESEIHKYNLRRAEALFTAAFGENHLLTYYEYLSDSVSNGISNFSWYQTCVELMDERMVYGAIQFDNGLPKFTEDSCQEGTMHSISCKQLNLFRYRPDMISNRQEYWLRNICSDSSFAYVSSKGYCGCNYAGYANCGVRPIALIY